MVELTSTPIILGRCVAKIVYRRARSEVCFESAAERRPYNRMHL